MSVDMFGHLKGRRTSLSGKPKVTIGEQDYDFNEIDIDTLTMLADHFPSLDGLLSGQGSSKNISRKEKSEMAAALVAYCTMPEDSDIKDIKKAVDVLKTEAYPYELDLALAVIIKASFPDSVMAQNSSFSKAAAKKTPVKTSTRKTPVKKPVVK